MRFEIGKYYKVTRTVKNWLGNTHKTITFFKVTNIISIADEDTVSYVGFDKDGDFAEDSRVFGRKDKIIEISPMDFYRAYEEYYVSETKKDIKNLERQIERAKNELQGVLDGVEKEERQLLADFNGVAVFFQKPSVKEVEVKDE